MNKNNRLSQLAGKSVPIMLAGLLLAGTNAVADVSGTVYRDLPVNGSSQNTYGVKDANEQGVAGVTVTVTDSSGAVVGTPVITDASGNWTVAGTAGDLRVEFSDIPSYLESSPVNTESNTTVQFITDGGTANLGLHNTADFMTGDPFLITSRYVNGQDHLSSPDSALFKWPYSNSGGTNANQETLATTDDLRSVWGLAYSQSRKNVYSATVLKRHIAVADHNADGTPDLGAIYVTNIDTGTTRLLLDIPDAGTVDTDVNRGLGEAIDMNIDETALSKVMKVGLGDIDISDDESTLYTVNLNNKKIYEIDVDTASITQSFDTPIGICTGGENRPFGLKYHDGELYVGIVCDASATACNVGGASGNCPQLEAYVFKYPAGSTTGTQVYNYRLDYNKDINYSGASGATKNWNPWTDNYSDIYINFSNALRITHPQPVLSDIEFSADGTMLVGFIDRSGFMGGFKNGAVTPNSLNTTEEFITINGGDILKALPDGSGGYTTSNHDNIDADNSPVTGHEENALGSIALIKGSDEAVFGVFDPLSDFHVTGVIFFNIANGTRTKGYQLTTNAAPNANYFGKGTGLGDLELITEVSAPLEIGNRVWDDLNSNGMQDAGEPGIDGVDVTLNCGSGVITQTTANGGQYLFTDNNVAGGIPRNTECTMMVPTEVNGKTLTNQTLTIDEPLGSNPATTGSFTFRTGLAGQNNHTYDIGYADIVVPQCMTITNTATVINVNETDTDITNNESSVSVQSNCTTPVPDLRLVKRADKTQVFVGEQVVFTIELTNEGLGDATAVQVEDQLPTGFTHVSNNPQQGTYNPATGIWDVGDLPAGQTLNLEITVSVE
jgi:uncharacterized repeat protein (TIGR01451 family)